MQKVICWCAVGLMIPGLLVFLVGDKCGDRAEKLQRRMIFDALKL